MRLSPLGGQPLVILLKNQLRATVDKEYWGTIFLITLYIKTFKEDMIT